MESSPGTTEQAWLDSVRARLLHGDFAVVENDLLVALGEHPGSVELRRVLAGVYQHTGRPQQAEAMLRDLLAQDCRDPATAFSLAELLTAQGRTAAAASVLCTCLDGDSNLHDTDLAIHAIELLDDSNRKLDAATIARSAIEANPEDARLHAYAGMLDLQLGAFESARQHHLFALQHSPQAWEWHVPSGLSAAQRYTDPAHPDIARFRDGLERQGLSDLARAELHFALGKALDDCGDYAAAAGHFREGNSLTRPLMNWSRKAWRRAVQARLTAQPFARQLEPTKDFVPLFIVGMPRSGTTLLAELLARHPGVCNRGELPWIAQLAGQPALGEGSALSELQRAATTYAVQSRRDDAGGTQWFIDKQPLNFRYVDLMLALFPDARVIHCQRGSRDTALSLWMQCFREPVQGYACDFGDIKVVMRDQAHLMAHWQKRHAESIRSIRYEELVASPTATVAGLAAWIGLPAQVETTHAGADSGIDTASVWQARQPVHTHSVGRWQHYAPHLPELMEFPDA